MKGYFQLMTLLVPPWYWFLTSYSTNVCFNWQSVLPTFKTCSNAFDVGEDHDCYGKFEKELIKHNDFEKTRED